MYYLWIIRIALVPDKNIAFPARLLPLAYALLLSAHASAAHAKDRCDIPSDVALVFWSPGHSVAPGETVVVNAYWTDNPTHYEPIPEDCVRDVAVSPSAIATILPDHKALHIAERAPDGAVVTLHAMIGARMVTGVARVVVAADHPLAGVWHEDRAAICEATRNAGSLPVGELMFDAEGRFSVTWEPFENRTDYRGTYRFDRASGALTLLIDTGNFVPGDARLVGSAKIDGQGRLTLTDLYFGTPRGGSARPSGCQLVFSR
jgi:hypothetical protein